MKKAKNFIKGPILPVLGSIMSHSDIGAYSKDLQRQRDSLLKDLKALEETYSKGEMREEQYREKRREIERAIIEVMDRLAQARFLMGEA